MKMLCCLISISIVASSLLAADFDPREYGARGDGRAKDTAAIQKAIDSAKAAGGGRVVLSPGTYLSGTIFLKSNIELTCPPAPSFSAAPIKPITLLLSAVAIVVICRQDRVSIAGKGRIDGNAKAILKPDSTAQPKSTKSGCGKAQRAGRPIKWCTSLSRPISPSATSSFLTRPSGPATLPAATISELMASLSPTMLPTAMV